MSTSQLKTPPITIEAGSDLSASQYCGVKLSSGKLALPSAGEAVIGVLYNKPNAAGIAGEVQNTPGEVLKWKLGGTVAADEDVKVDTSGRVVTASAADVALGRRVGKCIVGGAINQIGEVLFTGVSTAAVVSGVQALTGAGTVNATTDVTEWVATTDNADMDDGKYVGQRKIVRAATGTTGSNILTPTTVSADATGGTSPASVTYTAEGQETEWEWRSDGWKLVRIQTAGVETVAAAGTANPLVAVHKGAVDGTDTATLPDGYYPGQESFWQVISAASTPIWDIGGKFYDEDGSADGVNTTMDPAAAKDYALYRWSGARWLVIAANNYAIE